MRVDLPLTGPSYPSRSLPISAQVTRNLYPQIHPEGRNPISLQSFPGLKAFGSLAEPNRGLHVMADNLYAVSGQALFHVDRVGNSTSLGEIAGLSKCIMADNGTMLAIATGGDWYVWDGSLTANPDPDLYRPGSVDYLNNFFIWDNNEDSVGQFVVSEVGDPSSVDALDFAEAESHPDDIVRVVVQNQLAWFFGSRTIEPWFNSETGRPPFDRVRGGVKPYGLAGRYALAKSDENIYFIDNTRIPRMLYGADVQPIGNPAIGAEWQKYSTVSDAVCIAYNLDQQNFFQVTFPTADKTWLLHEQSRSWSELSSGVNGERYRVVAYANVYGKNIVATEDGTLYEMDFDTYDLGGGVFQRKRATAPIHGGLYGAPGAQMFFDKVEFIMETGRGLTTGQGSAPQVMVRYSDDGGRTYSAEQWFPLGAGGDYLRKVELYAQGSAYQRVYELTYSDPTPFTLISAHADVGFGE